MKKNTCSACTMLKAGVKFRKAPKHTCEKGFYEVPAKFKGWWYEVLIERLKQKDK